MVETPSASNREAASFSQRGFEPLIDTSKLPADRRTETDFMSQHRSLRASSTLGAKRNVLKRFERVALLKKRSQWKAGDRVTGLRKTKPEA